MLCFALFSLIDQRVKTCSGLDGWLETFRDFTGVVMGIIIVSHYRWEDFRKRRLPYMVWTVIWILGAVPAIWWGYEKYIFFNDWCMILLNVILYGYIVLHTVISVLWEKRCPKLNKPFAIAWTVMLLLMMVSRSNYLWPFAHLIMFGCFYLTDYSKGEEEDLFQGMLNGILLSFFLMQGWTFVFRPYDVPTARYAGAYSNCNMNALFYVAVLAAVFAKLVYVTRTGASRFWKLYYWLGAGVVVSLIFMTIGRTAWITAGLFAVILLLGLRRLQGSKSLPKNAVALLLCAGLTFPLVFGAVRYLPTVLSHPVWFWGEWSESKVHSFDAWDSEKYIEMDEFLDAALGRIIESIENVWEHSPFAIKAKAASQQDLMDAAVLTDIEGNDSLLVRMTIYKHYFSNLNLTGYPYEEQGFQLTQWYWIGHAHNIFLQYGTDFGVPVLILFVVLLVWAAAVFIRRFVRRGSEQDFAFLLFLLIPSVFGLFEYSWGVGSLSILMLFVTWRKVICNGEEES